MENMVLTKTTKPILSVIAAKQKVRGGECLYGGNIDYTLIRTMFYMDATRLSNKILLCGH